ncbi:MAG: response regulator, partial [Gammaproteobacteria bacterium]|nr:response regulator [Gammaproteobacteria bacterium]
MDKNFSVLVVDDQEINFDLVKLALDDNYKYEFALDGDQCLEMIETHQPDLILLDIDMPNMSGYEVCRTIKAHESNAINQIPVIFVSAKDTLVERLEGYEAGGEDYIVKPFQQLELVKKVAISINNKYQKEKLTQDYSFASSAAMSAMTTAAELGIIVNFLTHCHEHKTFIDLGTSVIDTLAQFGLNSAVQIHHRDTVVNVDSNEVSRPLEAAILEKARDQGRILDYGPRTVINYEHISVLFKNMPIIDQEKYGRYKDSLALLIEGVEARVKGIISEMMIQNQEEALLDMIDNTRQTLKEIAENNEESKNLNRGVMENLQLEISESLIGLDLSE